MMPDIFSVRTTRLIVKGKIMQMPTLIFTLAQHNRVGADSQHLKGVHEIYTLKKLHSQFHSNPFLCMHKLQTKQHCPLQKFTLAQMKSETEAIFEIQVWSPILRITVVLYKVSSKQWVEQGDAFCVRYALLFVKPCLISLRLHLYYQTTQVPCSFLVLCSLTIHVA